MSPLRKVLTGLFVVALLAGIAASSWISGEKDDPLATGSSTTIPGSDGQRFPADQVVWQTRVTGGVLTDVSEAAAVPVITIYGDGRIFRSAPFKDRRFDQPVPVMTAKVDVGLLSAFVTRAETSGLFDTDTDFGKPDVPDMATTVAMLHGKNEPLWLEAYALGGRFDADLSDAQAESREDLRRLLAAAEELVPIPEPWMPERVRVMRLADDATFDPKPDADAGAEPLPWPGPDLDELLQPTPEGSSALACGEVTGSAAAALFDDATENPLPQWRVDGKVRTLILVALLPGEAACPTA
ncbi:MAG: hypothetical protein ABI239_04110 [Aquihabitans sp.]